MAETTDVTGVPKQEAVVARQPKEEKPSFLAGPPIRMSWGAIFAGVVTALGVGALLHAFGLAIGLSAVDPQDPGTLRGTGIFTGIWSIVAALIALFVGGLVASRGAGILTRVNGAIHGLVMWGLTTLVAGFFLVNFIARVVGGVATVGMTAVQTGVGVAGDVGGAAETLGLDAQTLVGPINERLRADGRPEITAEQLQVAMRDVLNRAIREGRLDRDLMAQSLAQNTNLGPQDARAVAADIEAAFTDAQGRVGGALGDIGTGALQAVERTGQAFWGVFGAMLFGLLAAVFGATLGVSKRQEYWAEHMHEMPGTSGPTRH